MFRNKNRDSRSSWLKIDFQLEDDVLWCNGGSDLKCKSKCPKTMKDTFYELCGCFDILGSGRVVVKNGEKPASLKIYVTGLSGATPYDYKTGIIVNDNESKEYRMIDIAYGKGCATAILMPRHLSHTASRVA